MPDLNPRQFRMQTNMKAAPGSQGTLFQGGNPSPATGKPWPRGFSPQRRDEVRDALGWQPVRLRGARGVAGRPAFGPGGTRPEQAQGFAVIARSTVPAEHLRNVDIAFGQYSSDKESAGIYRGADPQSENPAKRKNVIAVYQGHAADSTTIHEIGHHASNLAGTPHSAYDTGEHKGTEEGYAENYAETHFRDRRGRPDANFETYAGKWGRHVEKHGYEFTTAFDRERQKSPSAQRQRERNAALSKPSSPSGIVGQLPLLHRNTEQSREYINARGDRGPDKVSWSYADLDRDPEQMTAFPWRPKTFQQKTIAELARERFVAKHGPGKKKP